MKDGCCRFVNVVGSIEVYSIQWSSILPFLPVLFSSRFICSVSISLDMIL